MDDSIESKRLCSEGNAANVVDYKRMRSEETFDTPAQKLSFAVPDIESPQNILNSLNDHCLQEIFKQISIVDLSSAADVCKRFKRNAEAIFLLCHAKTFHCISLTRMGRNFFHLIKTFYLNGSQAHQFLTGFNEKSMIQELHLRSALIDVPTLRLLLNKLTSLEISSSRFAGDPADLLSFCTKLLCLKVKQSRFGQLSPCNIPKLQRFEYDEYEYTENLLAFIESNPQLSSIRITTFDFKTPKDFQQHLLQIGNFKSLNSLKIPCYQCNVTPLIESISANNIRIQQLQLIDCRINDPATAFRHLFEMKGLKILSITGSDALSHEHFIGLAKQLPELRVLRLETHHNTRSTVTSSDVKSFVRHSKNLHLLDIGIVNQITIDRQSYSHLLGSLTKDADRTLTMTFIYVNSMNVAVPKKIVKEHKDKIQIFRIRYDSYRNEYSGREQAEGEDDDGNTDQQE